MKTFSETDIKSIADRYTSGESINSIAHSYGVHIYTISRRLEKNGVKLRHDKLKKGDLSVNKGEELIKWAKSQGRLVTKEELAKIAGTKRLSPSYFAKYPELGKYIKNYNSKYLSSITEKVYNWLVENNISFKPNDKTKIKAPVDFLLLEKYSNIALHITERPRNISNKVYSERIARKKLYAERAGVTLILLAKEDVDNIDSLKDKLNEIANS